MSNGLLINVGVFTILAVSLSNACDSGWFGPHENSCYQVFKERKNWQAAKKYCNDIGAHLAIVMSIDENVFLKGKLGTFGFGNTEQVWMDGDDLKTEGRFIWDATGELFEIADWGPGEPNQNGGDEDCLSFFALYQFKWNDEHCDRVFPFICEKEQSPVVG